MEMEMLKGIHNGSRNGVNEMTDVETMRYKYNGIIIISIKISVADWIPPA